MSWTDYEHEKQFVLEKENKEYFETVEVIIPARFNQLSCWPQLWYETQYDICFKNTFIKGLFSRYITARGYELKTEEIVPFINSMTKYINQMDVISEEEFKKLKRDNFKSFNFFERPLQTYEYNGDIYSANQFTNAVMDNYKNVYLLFENNIKILRDLNKDRNNVRHIYALNTTYKNGKEGFEDACDKLIPAAIKFNENLIQYYRKAEQLVKKYNSQKNKEV